MTTYEHLSGIMETTNELIQQASDLGYDLGIKQTNGYKKGFKDGYSQGYKGAIEDNK